MADKNDNYPDWEPTWVLDGWGFPMVDKTKSIKQSAKRY